MESQFQPTVETLTAIAERYLSIFDTLDTSILASIQSANFTHVFAPASANPPAPLSGEQFAAHFAHLRGIMRGFPVRAKQIWPNPTLKQVTIWADSETQFHEHVRDSDADEWIYCGEYMFVLTLDHTGTKIEHVLEFLDSKGTDQLRGLMARAWKMKEKSDRKDS